MTKHNWVLTGRHPWNDLNVEVTYECTGCQSVGHSLTPEIGPPPPHPQECAPHWGAPSDIRVTAYGDCAQTAIDKIHKG